MNRNYEQQLQVARQKYILKAHQSKTQHTFYFANKYVQNVGAVGVREALQRSRTQLLAFAPNRILVHQSGAGVVRGQIPLRQVGGGGGGGGRVLLGRAARRLGQARWRVVVEAVVQTHLVRVRVVEVGEELVEVGEHGVPLVEGGHDAHAAQLPVVVARVGCGGGGEGGAGGAVDGGVVVRDV